ncbi:unnamed protein product [Calypogeia fissa]
MDSDSGEQKKLRVVQAEVDRMKLLPPSSAYAIHRLRVLNKMTQILSVAPEKRSKAEVDELEQLFAGLSF